MMKRIVFCDHATLYCHESHGAISFGANESCSENTSPEALQTYLVDSHSFTPPMEAMYVYTQSERRYYSKSESELKKKTLLVRGVVPPFYSSAWEPRFGGFT